MLRQQTPLVKVLIVGAGQVGKTTLVQRYVFNEYLEAAPTIGVNFAQKVCLGETGPLNLSIWDLSGQSRFRFLMPQFCSGASAVVLVIDQTRPDTLNEAEVWLNLVGRYAHPSHQHAIVLAGAKSDLASHISHEVIRSFCTNHDIFAFIPYSSKTGSNVNQVFESLTRAIQLFQLEGTTPTASVVFST
ncbi:MAG: Rab family GTPase [Candidatus Hodarchaeota archaeon]